MSGGEFITRMKTLKVEDENILRQRAKRTDGAKRKDYRGTRLLRQAISS